MRVFRLVLFLLAAPFMLVAQTSLASNQASSSAPTDKGEEAKALLACAQMVNDQLKDIKIPNERGLRFQGKVSEATALCRGGDQALQFRATPWVDWTNYWGTGDMSSLPSGFISAKLPAQRGVIGALLDLELQRVELIKFNLFENSGTFADYVKGRNGVSGSALKVWPEMRLQPANPSFKDVGGDGPQVCKGDLIRWRTVTGICNDILNPAMGSTGMLFARNVEFETSFPDLGLNELTRNRHGNRLSLLRARSAGDQPPALHAGAIAIPTNAWKATACPATPRMPTAITRRRPSSMCWRHYWIQFMTHDWFSHLEEGHNAAEYMKVGCETKLVNNVEAAAHARGH